VLRSLLLFQEACSCAVNFRKLSECELIHAYVNIGSRIQRARVASTLPLFSEKAVNIIITYAFILGAVYFSPQLLHASSTAVVCDTESNGIREEVDFHHLAII